jgi:hypothetical protein
MAASAPFLPVCRRAFCSQALRHMYVLASQQRILRAVDVHVRQPVYVPVSLEVAAGGSDAAAGAGAQTGDPGAHDFENIPCNQQHMTTPTPMAGVMVRTRPLSASPRSGALRCSAAACRCAVACDKRIPTAEEPSWLSVPDAVRC